ncbi:MAG: hypothetical protein LW870_23835 [Pirellula sp.]|jgi:hypothetical protein|nr:hypothetical protein [Pirellula sp.]
MSEGYQLLYPDCIRRLTARSAKCPVAMAGLSWIVLRLNFSHVKELAGITFEVLRSDYPGIHFTIGAKYQDPTVDREFVIVTLIEHLLNTAPSRDFFDFATQNDSWQNEIDRLKEIK